MRDDQLIVIFSKLSEDARACSWPDISMFSSISKLIFGDSSQDEVTTPSQGESVKQIGETEDGWMIISTDSFGKLPCSLHIVVSS